MKDYVMRILRQCPLIALLWGLLSVSGWAAEPKVQILSPSDGAKVVSESNMLLVSGKVASDAGKAAAADIVLVLDISGSTANEAGAEFATREELPDMYVDGGPPQWSPQISISRGGFGIGPPVHQPTRVNLRHSILGAEVVAARRLLAQLNAETTRVGVIVFAKEAKVLQPLTHEFDAVRRTLDEIYRTGPNGGTNMVEGLRAGIKELLGIGQSAKRPEAVRAQFLLTDGLPSLPIGDGKRSMQGDTDLAINAARLSGKAGIKVHVFALGDEVVNYPWAAMGIAKESTGTYTPVKRPADVLGVMDNVSVVGVDHVQIINQTLRQRASQLRLAADGFYAGAVPLAEGANQIEVIAHSSNGTNGRQVVTVNYQPGKQKSLELEVFLEKEKNLKLQIERLGKSPEQIQRDVDRTREDSLRSPQQLPPPRAGNPG